MAKMTLVREKILEYIKESIEQQGYPPSVREICSAVGLKSPSTVHAHLKILKDGGYLEKSDHKTRALSVKNHTLYQQVPVLGQVTAGAPILAVEQVVGYVPYTGQGGQFFALRVRGDSMIGAGILENDIVIIRQQSDAVHGEIVVALIGEEATVKRLWRRDGTVMLMPENPAYEPIVSPEMSILGVVKAVYREY